MTTRENRVPVILVVEDERLVAKDIQATLIALGYDVPAVAATAEDALRKAEEHRPDLVLMDIMLNGQDAGIDAARSLRDRWNIPVVYLTAFADEGSVRRARDTEPLGYVLKPFHEKDLRSAVEIALYKHETESRRRERERWFSTTLRSIGDAVMATDASEVVTFMNPVAEALTGWTMAEATGRPLSEVWRLVDEETGADVQSPVTRVLRPGRVGGAATRTALMARSGVLVPIDNSAAPIVDEKGVLFGVVLVFRGTQERKLLEQRLLMADRFASLGTLAAGIAHEINNPLAYVIANLTFALEQVSSMESEARADVTRLRPGQIAQKLGELREALDDALQGGDRVKRIVADMKLFSRPEQQATRPVDVDTVLASSLQLVWNELRHRANLRRDFAAVSRVEANEARLGQVFVNLLMNAAQAIPEGQADKNEISVRTYDDGEGHVIVEIADTGQGISAEHRRRIFDPFFTTRPVGSGTGLGLSICHRVVADLGGEITVESQAGRGSVFKLRLPTVQKTAAPRPVASVPKPQKVERERILIVDDDAAVAQSLRRTLQREHEVIIALSAAEALERLGAGETFDAAICDLMMPDMTGMELYEELRREHPLLAANTIFMTGGAFTERARAFLDAVPNEHIDKPFDPTSLRKSVADLLGRQHAGQVV